MGKIAFLFPGQGSQAVGMGKGFADTNHEAAEIFQKADQRLQISLSKLVFEGPKEELTQTINTQPALLTTSIAILQVFKTAGIEADYVAGHSLGEYSALVAAEAIDFADAVYAVRMRGAFMEEAVPTGLGAMAAILGMERRQLQEITEEISAEGNVVELANLNSPGQIVISGSKEGVQKASQVAKEKGAKRAIPLQVSGPFHSSLMKPAADKLAKVLAKIKINDGKIPVISNVSATEVTSEETIRRNLLEQVFSPVLWEDSISYLVKQGVDTFIEIGPGNVLGGLVKKIAGDVYVYAVNDRDTMAKTVASIKGGNASC